MKFSIIVPTYNDATLKDCLDSLVQLSYPPDQCEVIVVDNRSDVWVKELITQYPFRYEREEAPGSYAARNRGISIATGSIIAFTDADCVVAPDWLQQLERACDAGADGVVGFAAGNNRNVVAAYEQQMYEENINRFVQGPALRRLDTRNAAVTRQAIERTGPFAASLQFGGDWEYGSRMHAAGLLIRFAADARVTHTNPTRLRTLLRKRVAQNEGTMRVHELHDTAFLTTYFPQLIRFRRSLRTRILYTAYQLLFFCILPVSDPLCTHLPRRMGYLFFKSCNVLAVRIGRLHYIITHT